MTIQASGCDYGVDVSKQSLQIEESSQGALMVANDRNAIRAWLKSLPKRSCFAVEATGTYHCAFIEAAHRRGHRVYLVDAFRLSRYRDSVGGRAKTDLLDAQLLRRYLQHEKDALRPWEPPPAGYSALLRLLHRRERLVASRVMIEQSLRELPECRRSLQALVHRMNELARVLERRIVALVHKSGWAEAMQRCQQIEGIGPLTAAALSTVWQRGRFAGSDAFIAFLGLDVRARDSGTFRGKRKLSKRGDSELRRLLYNAAMCASRTATWAPYYRRHLERGLAPTQALVALARKLARVAFALMRDQAPYQPRSAPGA